MARLAVAALAVLALAVAAQATSFEVEQAVRALRGIKGLAAARSLLQTYAAGEYSKCLYSSGTCSINYLYLASSDFGATPKNNLQELMLGYAYRVKQCAAKNGDASGCDGIDTCTYRTSTNLCQYDDELEVSNIASTCSGAKISLDSFANMAGCALLSSSEADCKAKSECKFANNVCSANADVNALAAFVAYFTTGSGSWDDSWFGTCDAGKMIKTVFTTCHGNSAASCPTDKCEFSATTCTPQDAYALTVMLGSNEFTTKFTAADAACATKTTRDTCEAEKGPAVTADLSKYSDVTKLEQNVKSGDGGGAAGLARSAALMAAGAAAAVLLAMAL